MSEEMNQQSEQNQEQKNSVKKGFHWKSGIIGAAVGAVVVVFIMVQVMPSMMITTRECKMGVEETVAALEERIPEHGWSISHGKPINMNEAMAKRGVDFEPKIRLVKLCKAPYAKSVLTSDRWVSCMMPCKMAVWEGDNGKAYLSEMNLSLMAKLFGGNIKKVMGGKVVEEEEKILEGLLK
ncbi:DUF302 domain-containing protein [Sedimentisphaera salicampi]|uniref:DUF302 domain-containing protein n=1 Tax=Sedimentisphaera salicampi TaxID=1941349 RepID=A0A1W6LL24_9BACT|nr:DUF302 domain-containing protein [Sedimentisphaera salicampi]ARN56444.1 hypothetical protein STSP1_00826 [Sedimentisphaera salicampi]